MPRAFTLRGPALFPSAISGLVAWYDPSVASSIIASAGRVSQWNDLSGNGHHLVQASAGVQPLSGTDTINGLNVLKFDNTRNDWLEATAVTVAQPLTLLAVVKAGVLGGNAQIFANNPATQATLWADSQKWSQYAGSVADSATSVDTNKHLLVATFNGASSQMWLDSTSISTANPGASGRTTIRIGADGTNAWNGDIGEAIVYSVALSSANRQLLEAYLKAKWGTP